MSGSAWLNISSPTAAMMRSAGPRALRTAGRQRLTPGWLMVARPSLSAVSAVSMVSRLSSNTHNHNHNQTRSLSTTATCRQNKLPEYDFDWTVDEPERQWSTPLAKQLAQAIQATGPVPLASYMRMCLTSDLGGYYSGALEEGRDQFGLKGDFVTSPEISQVFGELMGVWFVTEWIAQGRPSQGVELIEVGPGRGTLMDDMLRTIQSFPAMARSVDAIYMVEASPELRVAQKKLLCEEDAPMTESKVGYHSICKYTSLPIVWTETIKSIPVSPEKMPLIVAHEFFDALPIHAFQCVHVPATQSATPSAADQSSPSSRTSQPTLQWREMLVSPTPPDSTHVSLGTPRSQSHDTPPPDFQLTLAKAPTRHSLYLPESSARYRAIKKQTGPGALLEICPDAALYAADFAARIGGSAQHPKAKPSGAALILDYGPGDGTVPTNSLRGIRRHRRVSPFAEPGLTDLSADVDFAAIAEVAMRASEGIEVHGPVDQGTFLQVMGIRERAEMLIKVAAAAAAKGQREQGDEQAAAVVKDPAEVVHKAWKRLVDQGPGGMGKVYKVMSILPENEGKRRPVGFGGDVVA
ncbi:putative S-adenosyl-L-methionine-dependent methyltransferase-domain-containing protein [Podospora didyma]|uniref:Protein arginine methyltransferase NDUFAF7 n=1 Tax=Podospora didyma TaxID=330526 RepID=A0AAE0KEK6_9PEZI|nr:putative S-adenosyl-L-methionine-dependent methyltransferase-domain-containing protein [Podospora didyma]